MSMNIFSEGAARIVAERKRQIEEEGWTEDRDDDYKTGELILAALRYLIVTVRTSRTFRGLVESYWPWSEDWFKASEDDEIRSLEKAGALIAADIDRRLRLRERQSAAERSETDRRRRPEGRAGTSESIRNPKSAIE